ncbi:MAG: O-antigen ligase family protein, partial [Turicibacter sanguinis]
MLNQLKSMIKSPSFYGILVFIFLVIQPLVDLDYLLNDFLKQYHLIVPSTIVRFLILPLLAVGAFILVDKHKKRTFIGAAIIAIIWIAYVVLHFISTKNLDLFLPANYQFLTGIELKYILTMTLPFVLMYVVWMANFSEKSFNRVILCVSTFVCGVIFITDLLAISKGSYGGYTQSSFISWFMGGYEQYKATQLTSKGFFQEANVIGALLFMLLPLLYKVLYEVKR